MLEEIRKQCMVRTEKRFVLASRLKTRFTKRAHAEIEKMIKGSQFCQRSMARHNLHQVNKDGIDYRVDMNQLTCGCRKWQMTGIPCIHGAAVIIGKKQKVEDYVVHWYTTETWRLTYENGIAPVQGELLWPRLNRLGVLPPPWRKGNPGRPRNHARRKGRNETNSSQTRLSRKDRIMTCSNCREEGHNKASCKNPRVENPPSRRPGRPRKEHEPRVVLFGQGQASQSQASQGHVSQGQPSQVQASRAHDAQVHSRAHGAQAHSQGQTSEGQASQSQGQASQAHGSQSQGQASQSHGWASWFGI